MKRLPWITCLGLATLLLASCGNEGTGEDAAQAPAPANPAPAAPVATAPDANATKTQPFSNSLVTAAPGRPAPVPGLVQPTNATERLTQIPAGRSDPFAIVAANPIVIPAPRPAVRSVPQVPAVPRVVPAASAPQRSTLPNPPAIARAPLSTTPLPVVAPASTDINRLPGLVSPTTPTSLASAIEISGVVHAGSQLSAIVKAPNESTSRYVSVGEYISDGQVLVKRIEMPANTEPMVVLQQNGIEVIKMVGSPSGPIARAL